MQRMYRAARDHDWQQFVGLRPWTRHSFILATASFVYIMYGVTMTLLAPTDDRAAGLALATRWMDLSNWGWVWIFVGTLAFASTRWPPASETWGYSAMGGLAALWSGFYLLSMIFLGSPVSGIVGMLIWTLVAFIWWGISGLRNPEKALISGHADQARIEPSGGT